MDAHIDPVCGMTVNPATAAGKFDYEGTTYYFCHPNCLQRFSADPPAFLNKAPQPAALQAAMPRPMVQLSGKSKSLPVMTSSESHVDPVCGMTVDPATAAGSAEHEGKTYYFCSAHCLEKFRADPEALLHLAPQTPAPAGIEYTCPMDPEVVRIGLGACPKCGMALEPKTPVFPATKTEYVCPMHPEIVRDEPGSCPICGMALEPRVVTLEEEENPDARRGNAHRDADRRQPLDRRSRREGAWHR